MARHRNMRQIEQEALNEDEYEDYDDNYDPDFNADEYINDLLDAMDYSITKEQARKALEKKDWDFDKALDYALNVKVKEGQQKDQKKETKQPPQSQQKDQNTQQQHQPQKQQQGQHQQQQQQQALKVKKEESKEKYEEKKGQEAEVKRKQIVKNLKLFNSVYPSQKYTLTKTLNENKNLNIVVAGHVDSGKSTLTGHLLLQLEEITQSQMHKFEKQSQETGKGSFKFAWALDETTDERTRGVTVDISTRRFKYKDKQITLLDAPGHRDFVPNMINGAAQADYAIIVIDSTSENFLSGFLEGGQTLEHGKVLKSLGVEEIIFAVNKLDLLKWDQKQFEYIKGYCIDYFQKLQYHEANMYFVPVSGLQGENLMKKPKVQELAWYKGPCLMDLVDKLEIPKRGLHKPTRLSVFSYHHATQGKLRGNVISGRVEGGAIIKGNKYKIMPNNIPCTVKEIMIDDSKEKEAIVGENPELVLHLDNEYDSHYIMPGDVLCSADLPIPTTDNIIVEIMTLESDIPLIKGMRVITYIGQQKQSARIVKIDRIFDKNTGEVIKKNPKCLIAGQHAVVEMKLDQPACAEILPNFNVYSRVTIREKYTILAIGVIIEIK